MGFIKPKKKKVPTRVCTHCNKEKPLKYFWNDKCKYFSYNCKHCRDKF